MKTIVVTGFAGFIGFHLSRQLIENGYRVIGIDLFNDDYDVVLKRQRMQMLKKLQGDFCSFEIDLCDEYLLAKIFNEINDLDAIVHLSASSSALQSVTSPKGFIDNNITAFLNVIEAAKNAQVGHFIYASSAAVYGKGNAPTNTLSTNTNHPTNIYAVTKLANEHLAYTYSSLYQLPTTGLRLFTVYGPWGRPDMVISIFTKAILEAKPLLLHNFGQIKRDFVYIDDVIRVIREAIEHPRQQELTPFPYRLLNVGTGKGVYLLELVKMLEHYLQRRATMVEMEMPLGGIETSSADPAEIEKIFPHFKFKDFETGLKEYIQWHLEYYENALDEAMI